MAEDVIPEPVPAELARDLIERAGGLNAVVHVLGLQGPDPGRMVGRWRSGKKTMPHASAVRLAAYVNPPPTD